MSDGSVNQSRYLIRLPSRVMNLIGPIAILPINAGGAGGRFFSVRLSGVTGKGRGGNDSPPVRLWRLGGGGGPQSIGPLRSAAAKSDCGTSPPVPAASQPAAQLRANCRRDNSRKSAVARVIALSSLGETMPAGTSPWWLERRFNQTGQATRAFRQSGGTGTTGLYDYNATSIQNQMETMTKKDTHPNRGSGVAPRASSFPHGKPAEEEKNDPYDGPCPSCRFRHHGGRPASIRASELALMRSVIAIR